MKRKWGMAGLLTAVILVCAVAVVILIGKRKHLNEEADIFSQEGKGYTLQIPNYSEEMEIVYSEYDHETDWDWMYATTRMASSPITEGNGNYYVRLENYIYVCDFVNDRLIPLCNRPDCLHDKETEYAKLGECMAYVPMGATTSMLQYYEGKLYANAWTTVQESSDPRFGGNYMYELALDGSSRKLLSVTCEESVTLMLHRGKIYYCAQTQDQETLETTYEVREVPLEGGDYRMIMRMDTDDMGIGIGLFLYGNCLYIEGAGTNCLILYDMEKGVSCLKTVEGTSFKLFPEESKLYLSWHEKIDHDLDEMTLPIQGATTISEMELNGNVTGTYGQLQNGDMESLGIEPRVGGKSPYLSMDENYIYQMMNEEWVLIYDRESMEVVQKIPVDVYINVRVGLAGDYLLVSDRCALLWLEKDKMLEEGARFHVMQP